MEKKGEYNPSELLAIVQLPNGFIIFGGSRLYQILIGFVYNRYRILLADSMCVKVWIKENIYSMLRKQAGMWKTSGWFVDFFNSSSEIDNSYLKITTGLLIKIVFMHYWMFKNVSWFLEIPLEIRISIINSFKEAILAYHRHWY